MGCIAEDGAEPMLYPDSVAKFFFDCIEAGLETYAHTHKTSEKYVISTTLIYIPQVG